MTLSKQHGFTLVEVLIALIIFSIGLLGVAGLQLAGMKANHDSLIRTQATQLAESIAEKMLANEVDLRAGKYIFSNFDSSVLVPSSMLPPLTAGVDEALYSPLSGDISSQDLTEWQARLADELPQGVGLISCIRNPLKSKVADPPCSEFSQGAIIISWQERGNRGTEAADTVVHKKVVLNVLF